MPTLTMPEGYSKPYLKRGVVHRQVAGARREFANLYPVTLLSDLTSWEYDAGFEAAVRAYQASAGLPASGEMDDTTWAKLLGVSVDRVATYDLENETPPKGGNPLLWIAAAAAAWWALS